LKINELKAGSRGNPQYVGWGVGLVDLDNDGWRDVFQVNGHVYPELDRRNGNEKYRNPRLVYRSLGGGRFEDVSALAGPGVVQKMSSRGAAFGDFDNDGDIDVVIRTWCNTDPLAQRSDQIITGEARGHGRTAQLWRRCGVGSRPALRWRTQS
jgi:hypothetical protein